MTTPEKLLEQLTVLRAQSGDDAAFARLVEHYHPRLLYFVRRLAGESAADDILQNVWLDAYNQKGRLKAPEAWSVWLYRIAHNKAVQAIRKDARYQPLSETEIASDAPVDDSSWSAEDAALVHQAIETLSPEHREAVTLRFIEDMSYADIAEVVGCGVGTVRSRLHYAKQKIRDYVEARRHE